MAYYNSNSSFPGADIPTGLIVLAFMMAWPVGVGLLIAKIIGTSQRDAARAAERRSVYVDGATGEARQTAAQQQAAKKRTTAAASRKAAQQKQAAGENRWSVLLLVLGAVVAVLGILNVMDPLRWLFLWGFDKYYLWQALSGLGWSAAGLGLIFGSRKVQRKERLLKKYKAVVGDRANMPIADIAAAIPASYADATKMLQAAIDKGMFGDKAYLDMRSRSLVVVGPAPEAPKDPAEAPEETPFSQQVSAGEYKEILDKIRSVNEAIPGEEMTAKIDRLEEVTTKIFSLVEKDPSKLPQLRSFMDYYLPTALKLLGAYSQFDKQGVEGENITAAKKKIEDTMDALVQGFEKQLDQLFKDDALDVTTDIKVLQDMMAQDGLSKEATFRLDGTDM